MRLLIAVSLLAATPAFAAEPAKTPVEKARQACAPTSLQPVQQAPAQPHPRRLGDLPYAHHMLTVDRRIDGCPVPVVVRYRVDEPAQARPRR